MKEFEVKGWTEVLVQESVFPGQLIADEWSMTE